MTHVTLTPRVERVLELASEEASQLGQDFVGTEHLLLGLLADGRGLAARVLDELGASEPARARLIEILSSQAYNTPSSKAYDENGQLVGRLVLMPDGRCKLVPLEEDEGDGRPAD